MKRFGELVHSLRVLAVGECKHKKALKHVNHGFHTAYLGWYVLDWHLPVSIIVLPLLVFAIASWAFHLELE